MLSNCSSSNYSKGTAKKSCLGSAIMPSTKSAFNQILTNLALARLIRRHGTVCQDETGNPCGRKMMNHVLYPSKVGVAGWRHAVFPANIFFQVLAPQSLMLNGGLARAKSARKSLWISLWNVSASCDPKLASIPRSARFIFASFQVVGFDSCP